MKFSTRTTYGLRALCHLAGLGPGEMVSLAAIAQQEGISLAYLERIFSRLKKTGIVLSAKGAQGGYCLSAPPSQIPVLDLVKALEGDLNLFHCIGESGQIDCAGQCHCGATKVLSAVQSAVRGSLAGLSLADLGEGIKN
jgi:Rrf2 family protein